MRVVILQLSTLRCCENSVSNPYFGDVLVKSLEIYASVVVVVVVHLMNVEFLCLPVLVSFFNQLDFSFFSMLYLSDLPPTPTPSNCLCSRLEFERDFVLKLYLMIQFRVGYCRYLGYAQHDGNCSLDV